MEAVVSTNGCVAATRTTRALGAVDVQAVKAVLQWRFEPGRVAERVVPMMVNIELTFTMK